MFISFNWNECFSQKCDNSFSSTLVACDFAESEVEMAAGQVALVSYCTLQNIMARHRQILYPMLYPRYLLHLTHQKCRPRLQCFRHLLQIDLVNGQLVNSWKI